MFQNDESSRNRSKPTIPEKPKSIPPISPTSKISNPLLASINSAMENRLAPRVVFKGDKKSRPPSESETSLLKAKPILLDKNQKKEADLIKQALKDRKIQSMSHVTPVLKQAPKSEPIQNTPAMEAAVRVSSPLKKSIFSKTDKDEQENTRPSGLDAPATPMLTHSDPCISTPTKADITVNKPEVPKALVSPHRANPTVSVPVMSPPAAVLSKPPALAVPEPVPQNGPQLKSPKPDIPIRLNSGVISPAADLSAHGLPEEATSIAEIPDILDIHIPPPIIPDDFSDGANSLSDMSANATPDNSFLRASLSVTPISSSPAHSRTPSPISAAETPDSPAVFSFSPLPMCLAPPTSFESDSENSMAESVNTISHTGMPSEVPLSSSPKTISAVSALARAEEMIPVKHNSCDRLLNLLEKAKRKSTTGSQTPTPGILPIVETDTPLESSPPETEPFLHVDTPTAPETLITVPNIPPVDYDGKTKEAATTDYNSQLYETTLNNLVHSKLMFSLLGLLIYYRTINF